MKKQYMIISCAIGALTLNALSDNDGSLLKRIEGEWIMFRGDSYEIKNISNGKVTSKFYRWDGRMNFERSADISLRDQSSGEQQTIIDQGAKWDYLASGNTPENNSWTGLSFDGKKAGWKTGKAGFGYGDDDDQTLLEDMQNKYSKVFIRKEFTLPEGTKLNNLALLINYDDAFVLHVNGRRLMNSKSLTINEKTGEVAVNNHEANGSEYFSLNDYAGAFKAGKNVIAFEGHNTNLESSDFTLDPQLIMGGSTKYVLTNRTEKTSLSDGDWWFKKRAWNGKIDELTIWGKALNDEEVADLWNEGKGRKELPKGSSKSLIGHWPFDGDLHDKSGNKRNASGHNSPGFSEGKIGKALELNGENQYVTLGGKPVDYAPKSGSITISFWFSADKLDHRWQTLISNGDAGWGKWRIHRHQFSDNISYMGGAMAVNKMVNINDGELHHLVAVTEKDKEVRLYIDNKPIRNTGNNGVGNLTLNKINPTVGAELQGLENLKPALEGALIPSQDSLRITVKPLADTPGFIYNNRAGVYKRTSDPEIALLLASQRGDQEKVSNLLNSKADANAHVSGSYNALAYAASRGHLDVVKTLLNNKADVNKAANFQKTPLLVTAGTNQIDAAKLLLANGANLNAQQGQGAYATHEACFFGQPEMLKFLLKKGLDPNLQNSGGFTAMHFAVWQMQEGRHEWNEPRIRCVKLLMDNGANPKLKAGNNNQSPIQQALSKGLDHVVKILIK